MVSSRPGRAVSRSSSSGSSRSSGSVTRVAAPSVAGHTSKTFEKTVAADRYSADQTIVASAQAQGQPVPQDVKDRIQDYEQSQQPTSPPSSPPADAEAVLKKLTEEETKRLQQKYPGSEAYIKPENIRKKIIEGQEPPKPTPDQYYPAYTGPDAADALRELKAGAGEAKERLAAGEPGGVVATGVGANIAGRQEAYTRASARIDPATGEPVPFGGAMAGQLKPEEAMKLGFATLFSERAKKREGTPTWPQFETKIVDVPRPALSREQEAQQWRDIGVYERQGALGAAASAMASLQQHSNIYPHLRDVKSVGFGPYGLSLGRVTQTHTVEYKERQPEFNAADVVLPKITATGIKEPTSVGLLGGVALRQRNIGGSYITPEKQARVVLVPDEVYTPTNTLGHYARAGFAGFALGALAGAPAGPAGIAIMGAKGAGAAIAFHATASTVKPHYSVLTQRAVEKLPEKYQEAGEVMLTPGPPGINLIFYGATKFNLEMQKKIRGDTTPLKRGEVAGEVAGATAGAIASLGVGIGLGKVLPTPQAKISLRYRDTQMQGVKFNEGTHFRALVLEKGTQAKTVIGRAGGKTVWYGQQPTVTFQRAGVSVGGKVGGGVGRLSPSMQYQRLPVELTSARTTPAVESQYLDSSLRLMDATKSQKVPKASIRSAEDVLKDVRNVPAEYRTPILKYLQSKDRFGLLVKKHDFQFGGFAREAQVMQPKTTGDIDRMLVSGDAQKEAAKIVNYLSGKPGPGVRVSPSTPSLVEVKAGSTWKKLFDIHDISSPDIQQGVRVNAEYFGWGHKITHPTVKTPDGIYIRALREEGLATGSAATMPKGVAQPFTPTETMLFKAAKPKYLSEGGVFETASHRLKDVGSFYRQQESLVSYGGGKPMPKADLQLFKTAADTKFTGVVDKAGTRYSPAGVFVEKGGLITSLAPQKSTAVSVSHVLPMSVVPRQTSLLSVVSPPKQSRVSLVSPSKILTSQRIVSPTPSKASPARSVSVVSSLPSLSSVTSPIRSPSVSPSVSKISTTPSKSTIPSTTSKLSSVSVRPGSSIASSISTLRSVSSMSTSPVTRPVPVTRLPFIPGGLGGTLAGKGTPRPRRYAQKTVILPGMSGLGFLGVRYKTQPKQMTKQEKKELLRREKRYKGLQPMKGETVTAVGQLLPSSQYIPPQIKLKKTKTKSRRRRR
jgi:hypothetical protein